MLSNIYYLILSLKYYLYEYEPSPRFGWLDWDRIGITSAGPATFPGAKALYPLLAGL